MASTPRIDSIQRQPFHRAHRNFFVGLFTFVALAFIAVALIYTVSKHEMFQDWRVLHVVYESSYGLGEGDVVTISDIRVGDVKSVELTESGKAAVTFRVLARHAQLIRSDSRALLRQKNILTGDWLIALTKGTNEAMPVGEHDTLAGEPPMRLDRVITQITSMVSTFEDILDQVKSGNGLLGEVVMGDSLLGDVHRAVGDLASFARAAKKTVQRFDGTAAKFSAMGESWTELSDSVGSLITTVGPAVTQAQGLLSDLRTSSGHLSPVLEQALVDLREIEVLLKGLQNHWLFKRSVEKGRNATQGEEKSNGK
jgi:ABC-type transporter Mla subunit MlaD